MYGVMLIGVLALAGGVIAFVGDRLGTKIGKKRLSLFGLRPRHTSIIVTVITGMCITLLTFGVMAVLSENVRTALFGMEQLNRNMEKTRQDLMQVSKELLAAQEEKQNTTVALAKSKKDIEDLQKERQELEVESERLAEGNRRLVAEKEILLAQNNELAALNEQLAGNNAALTSENQSLNEQNADLSSSNEELNERAKTLREGLTAVREGNIIYRAGEVIAEGVIKGGRSKEEVTEDVDALIQAANRNVSERTGNNGDILVYKPNMESAIDTLANSKQNIFVRVAAAGNLVKGEPIHTSLELFPNNHVYDENEFVTSQVYNVIDLKDGDAENIVMNFLQQVNKVAGDKGIVKDPIRNSVGVMDAAQFYELVDAIRPLKGNIIISAYAKESTDAAGPLRLKMKIEQES